MNYGVTIHAEPGHEAMAEKAAQQAFGHWGESLAIEVSTADDTCLVGFMEWSDDWPDEREPEQYDLLQAPHIEEGFAVAMARLLRAAEE